MSDPTRTRTTADAAYEAEARAEAAHAYPNSAVDQESFLTAALGCKPTTGASHCYLCRGEIGVHCWTDQKGKAHPWCANPAAWRPELKGRDVLPLRRCT